MIVERVAGRVDRSGCQYSRYHPLYLYTDDTPLLGSIFDLCGVQCALIGTYKYMYAQKDGT